MSTGLLSEGEAQAILDLIAPACDLLAAFPPTHRGQQSKGAKLLNERRWIFYRLTAICNDEIAGFTGRSDLNWYNSPIRRRDRELLQPTSTGEPWYLLRCGRPTKKGDPCRARLANGRAYCWRHSTEDENRELRYWQDSVHLPFPRVKTEGTSDRELNDLISGLRSYVEDMS